MACLKLKEMPQSCIHCPLGYHEFFSKGEKLTCMPLSSFKEKEVCGDFLKRRSDCPLEDDEID